MNIWSSLATSSVSLARLALRSSILILIRLETLRASTSPPWERFLHFREHSPPFRVGITYLKKTGINTVTDGKTIKILYKLNVIPRKSQIFCTKGVFLQFYFVMLHLLVGFAYCM
jgi:hypothetical protein